MKKLKELIQKRGDHAALAEKLGITPALLSYWLKKGRIPAKHIWLTSMKTGISIKDLLPEEK